MGKTNETHIYEYSKLTSTDERKHVMFAFLGSGDTQNYYFQLHAFTCEFHNLIVNN